MQGAQSYGTALHLFTAGKEQPDWPAWWYTDLSGGLQGPFDPVHMLKWCQDGVLPSDLQCCATAYPDKAKPPPPDVRFQSLGALLALVERGGSYTPIGAATNAANTSAAPSAPPSRPIDDPSGAAAAAAAAAASAAATAATASMPGQAAGASNMQQQQQQQQQQQEGQEGKAGSAGSSAPPPRRPETRVSGGIVSTLDPKAERYVPPHMRSMGSSDTAARPDQGASSSPGSSGASSSAGAAASAAMHPLPGPLAQVPARHPWSTAASGGDNAAHHGPHGPHGPLANASQPGPMPPSTSQHMIAPLPPLPTPAPTATAEPSEGAAALTPAQLQAAVTKLFKHEGSGGSGPELKWRVILASGDRAGPFTGAHMLAWTTGGDPPPGASRNKAGPAHACLACGIVAADYNAQRLPGSKFYKSMSQLLAAAAAGVRYEPVTKHDLARGYPPRGWNEAGSGEAAGAAGTAGPAPQQNQQPPLPPSLMPQAQRNQQQGRKHNTPQRHQQHREHDNDSGQEHQHQPPQRSQQDRQKQREASLLRNQQQREAREAQQREHQLMQQQLQQLQLQQRQQQMQQMQHLQQQQVQHPHSGPGTPLYGAGVNSPWGGPGAANAAGLPPHMQAQFVAQQAQLAHHEQLQQMAQQEQERLQHARQQHRQQRQQRLSNPGAGLGPTPNPMSSMPPGSGVPGAPGREGGGQYAIVDVGGAPVLVSASVAASLPAASASVAPSFSLPMRGVSHSGAPGGGGLMLPAGLGQQHMQQQQQQQQQQQHMRGGPQMMGRGPAGMPGGWQAPGGPMQGPGENQGPGGPLHGMGGPMQGGPGGQMQGGPGPEGPARGPQRTNPAALLLTGGQALPELFPLWFVRRGDGPAHGPLPAQALLPELMSGTVAEDALACCVTPGTASRMHTVGGSPPATAFVPLRTLLVAAAAGHVLLPWRGVEDPATAGMSPTLLNTLTGATIAVGPGAGAGHAAGPGPQNQPPMQNQPLAQHMQMQQLQMQQQAQLAAQQQQLQMQQQGQGQQGGTPRATVMPGGPHESLMPGTAPPQRMAMQQRAQQQAQQGQRPPGAPPAHHPGLAALTAHVFTAGGLPPQAWPVWFLALNPDGPVDGPLEAAQCAAAFNSNSLPLNTPVCGVARALLPQLRGGPPREAFQPLSTLLLAVSRGEGLPAPLGSNVVGSMGANMPGATMPGANLPGANMPGASMPGANMAGAMGAPMAGGMGAVAGSLGSMAGGVRPNMADMAAMPASNGAAAVGTEAGGVGGEQLDSGSAGAAPGSAAAAAGAGAAAQENGSGSGDKAGSAADGVEVSGAATAEPGIGADTPAAAAAAPAAGGGAAAAAEGDRGVEQPAASKAAVAMPEHSSWGGLPAVAEEGAATVGSA